MPFQVLLWSPVLIAVVAAFLFLVYDSQRRLSKEIDYAEQWMVGTNDDEPKHVERRLDSAVNDWFVLRRANARRTLDRLRQQIQSAQSDEEALAWLRNQTDEQLVQLSENCESTAFQNRRLNEMRVQRLQAHLPAVIDERAEERRLAAARAAEKQSQLAAERDRQLREESEKEAQQELAKAQSVLRETFGFKDAEFERLQALARRDVPSPYLRYTVTHGDKPTAVMMRVYAMEIKYVNRNNLLAFSPDGRYLAFAGRGDGAVTVWDVAEGSVRAEFQQEKHQAWDQIGLFRKGYMAGTSVSSVAFTPDSKLLCFPDYRRADSNGSVKQPRLVIAVHRVRTTRKVYELPVADKPLVLQLVVSDKNELITRYGRWNLATGRKVTQQFGADLSNDPDAYAFTSDGRKFIVAQVSVGLTTRRTLIQCWTQDGHRSDWSLWSNDDLDVPEYFATYQPVQCLALSKDDKTCAMSFAETLAIRLIDVGSGKVRKLPLMLSDGELLPSESDNHSIDTAEFRPDGKMLALIPRSDTLGNYVLLQDSATGKITAALNHEAPTIQVRFSPDGRLLATATSAPEGPTKIHLWNVDSPQHRVEAVAALFEFEGVARRLHFAEAGTQERKMHRALLGVLQGLIQIAASAPPAPMETPGSSTTGPKEAGAGMSGSSPSTDSPTPSGGIPVTIYFHLPGKPLPGDTVLYSVNGPGDYRRSPKLVSGGRLELTLDGSGDSRIWFLIGNDTYSAGLDFHNGRFRDVHVR